MCRGRRRSALGGGADGKESLHQGESSMKRQDVVERRLGDRV